VLYLGSLSFANHPIPLLLDAFERVRQRVSSAVLLLVGGGEDYDRVAERIRMRGLEGAVILAGRIDPAQVASIYAASHLVVDPVFDDDAARARSPLKIVEGLAMGVPIVTGDVGDRAAMLDGGRAGVLVKPGSAEALAEGIVGVLNDRAWREEMAKQARLISQRFRWDHLGQRFAQIYAV
jgi:glycosyltransferase involved in cell wall biosynthesis